MGTTSNHRVVLLLSVLIIVANSTTYLRLSSYAQSTLFSGDSIISTAGTYRMTLNSSGCMLNV